MHFRGRNVILTVGTGDSSEATAGPARDVVVVVADMVGRVVVKRGWWGGGSDTTVSTEGKSLAACVEAVSVIGFESLLLP